MSASSRDIDRDLRVQQLRDQAERTRAQMAFGADTARDAAERARAQMATRAQEATARFGQAAGAQDIQAQIASDAAADQRVKWICQHNNMPTNQLNKQLS